MGPDDTFKAVLTNAGVALKRIQDHASHLQGELKQAYENGYDGTDPTDIPRTDVLRRLVDDLEIHLQVLREQD